MQQLKGGNEFYEKQKKVDFMYVSSYHDIIHDWLCGFKNRGKHVHNANGPNKCKKDYY